MGAETHNVRVLYSRKRKLIYQKWYLNLDTTRCTHAQTTAIGTGAFMVTWTGAVAWPDERSRSVTSGAPEAGLVLQIETLRFSPCTLPRSVTGRAGFAVQMLQIETFTNGTDPLSRSVTARPTFDPYLLQIETNQTRLLENLNL